MAFKKRYPGVEVEYFRSGPERNVTKLISEAKAGRYEVDLFQNTSVGTWAVMQRGFVDTYLRVFDAFNNMTERRLKC